MKFFTSAQINQIRKGFYSAVYFNRTKEILLQENYLSPVVMQIFQRKDGVTLCGVKEVLELLEQTTGYFQDNEWVNKFDSLKIEILQDGTQVTHLEPIMHISGPYVYFAQLESIYLGIFARRTSVATKVNQALVAAGDKSVLFFADRFDYYLNQQGDGYAASIGGIKSVATPAQAFWWDGETIGTIPHALIALDGGDTVKATQTFARQFPTTPVVALVDFHNDCVKTAVEVAQALKGQLWGVRLDTSESLVDASLQNNLASQKMFGVNPVLVKRVRKALDQARHPDVRIIVSGGFTADKIKHFEDEKTPVDIYGVGYWFMQDTIPFTADVVEVGGKAIAKAGRKYTKNERMVTIND